MTSDMSSMRSSILLFMSASVCTAYSGMSTTQNKNDDDHQNWNIPLWEQSNMKKLRQWPGEPISWSTICLRLAMGNVHWMPPLLLLSIHQENLRPVVDVQELSSSDLLVGQLLVIRQWCFRLSYQCPRRHQWNRSVNWVGWETWSSGKGTGNQIVEFKLSARVESYLAWYHVHYKCPTFIHHTKFWSRTC